jgi:primary-amine oxidase
MIQPLGPRYSIDKKENFISWMGFSFFLSTNPDTGLGLHDLHFDNDSILYELGLQEALAHYAGDDPSRGSLQFLDTLFGMGLNMRELVPGYDCPSYATYLDTRNWMGEKRVDNKRSICVFEYTADHVLQRHTATIGFQATVGVSVSRNTYLVVRSVSTMGNYDYTIDYTFFLDGTIEVKVRASGYILGAFTNAGKENQFGYRVDKAAATAIHDHVLNFKADFDLLGTSNTFFKVGVEPVEIEFGWDDERTRPRQTMHLVEEWFEKELGIDWPKNSGGMFIVRNENEVNKWGEKRGYRIMPGTGVGTPSHLAIKQSTALGRAAGWAMKDLWVVRQKDTEPRSADPLNNLDPEDPIIDFSKFVGGEEIANEDL